MWAGKRGYLAISRFRGFDFVFQNRSVNKDLHPNSPHPPSNTVAANEGLTPIHPAELPNSQFTYLGISLPLHSLPHTQNHFRSSQQDRSIKTRDCTEYLWDWSYWLENISRSSRRVLAYRSYEDSLRSSWLRPRTLLHLQLVQGIFLCFYQSPPTMLPLYSRIDPQLVFITELIEMLEDIGRGTASKSGSYRSPTCSWPELHWGFRKYPKSGLASRVSLVTRYSYLDVLD